MVSHMVITIRLLTRTGLGLFNSRNTIQTASTRRYRKLLPRLQPQPTTNTITIHSITCTLKWALELLHPENNVVMVGMGLVKKTHRYNRLIPLRLKPMTNNSSVNRGNSTINKEDTSVDWLLLVTISSISVSHALSHTNQLCKCEAGRLQMSTVRDRVARLSQFPPNGRPTDIITIQTVAVWAVLRATATRWTRTSLLIRSVHLFGRISNKTLA